jgi:rod shape-determining protein MreD
MRYSIYFLIGILLISLQTTVAPVFSPLIFLYDLVVPLVVFLVLFRPGVEGLIVIIGVGCGMDMLSGAPPGVYLLSYLWIFLLFKNSRDYLQLSDSALFQAAVFLGVLIELLIFGAFYALSTPSFRLSPYAAWIVFTQMFSAIITGPFVFIVFDGGFNRLETLLSRKPARGGLP